MQKPLRPSSFPAMAAALLMLAAMPALAGPMCTAKSRPTITPVVELYTSEGCSSCPPADRWASTLKGPAAAGEVIVEAFHVGYWDQLGWVDRFASPAYTARQRQVAAWNGLPSIYTPQIVRNGQDWHDGARNLGTGAPAKVSIELHPVGEAVVASVMPQDPGTSWAAYWTVTEDGHASKVQAGENAGENLRHDFVVRQYVQAGTYRGTADLRLRTVPQAPGHERRVNLVVFDPANGRTLQAVGAGC